MTSLKLPGVFILASASPRRKELIRLIGIDPKIEPSALEENARTTDPAELVRKLSAQKAADIASRHHDGEIVIGADTCVYLPPVAGEASETYSGALQYGANGGTQTAHPQATGDASGKGEILGKPHTHLEAAQMIRKLQGRTHEVYTGVTIIRCPATDTPEAEGTDEAARGFAPHTFVEKTAVTVYSMTEEEITLYSLLDEPMDKAGAYAVQGAFSRFIKSLDGDYFNVMGLPLGRLYHELKNLTS